MTNIFTSKFTHNNKIIITILLALLIYVLLQLTNCCFWVPLNILCTYVVLFFIPIVYGWLLCTKFEKRVKKRREVSSDELENLFLEIEHYSTSESKGIADRANSEKAKLMSLDRKVFEIDALPLRQMLVDLYNPEHELIAKSRRELMILEEYESPGDEDLIIKLKDRENKIIDDLERLINEKTDSDAETYKLVQLKEALRAELKTLRETVAWYDRTYAMGEVIRTSITKWVTLTLIVTLLIGILPIVHSQGNSNFIILHWAFLGITGSLLSTIREQHEVSLPELGETDGKQLILATVRNIAIGVVVSVILYAAILGQVLKGPIFPELPTSIEENSLINKDIGLSIFLGLFAGMSSRVLNRLTKVADDSLG